MTDVMAVQLDHPDWRLWPAVGDPGLWYARRLAGAIRDGIAARMPG